MCGSHRLRRCLIFAFATLTPSHTSTATWQQFLTDWQEQRKTSTRKLAGSAARISLPSSSPRTEFCNLKGEHFVKRLAARLADKWTKPYSTTMTLCQDAALAVDPLGDQTIASVEQGGSFQLSILKTELHYHFSAEVRHSTLKSPPLPPYNSAKAESFFCWAARILLQYACTSFLSHTHSLGI